MDNIFQLVVNYLLIAINIKAIIIEINLKKKFFISALFEWFIIFGNKFNSKSREEKIMFSIKGGLDGKVEMKWKTFNFRNWLISKTVQ
jgi:hypothetical protein